MKTIASTVRVLGGVGLVTLLLGASGCAKGEVTRTPEQWRTDVAAQMDPLIEDFRACYAKSKAGWAEHSQAMGGKGTVATMMKPKPRETVLVSIEIDSANAGDSAKASAREGYDDTTPKEELTRDGDSANCVRKVVHTKLKVPPKLDSNRGYGKWRVVFVPEGGDAPPPVTPATPAPKS